MKIASYQENQSRLARIAWWSKFMLFSPRLFSYLVLLNELALEITQILQAFTRFCSHDEKETSFSLSVADEERYEQFPNHKTSSSVLLSNLESRKIDENNQIEKNQAALALIKSWLQQKVDEQDLDKEIQEFEELKMGIANNRRY